MKIKSILYLVTLSVIALTSTAFENLVSIHTEDNYNESNSYQSAEQYVQGVNYICHSPWDDFRSGVIKIVQ